MKKIKFLLLSLVLASSTCFIGCGETKTVSVDNAKENTINNMSGEDLNKIMEDDKEKEKFLVIDVRDTKEYEEGHVKHAINIPLGEFDSKISTLEDLKDKNIVTICNTGKKSKQAAEKLVNAGFKHVFNAAGVKDFKYTTITKVTNLRGKDFVDLIASADSSKSTIVDARDAKDYEAGHVKNAINIQVKEMDSKLDSVPNGNTVYTYCYSGNRSFKIANALAEKGYKTYNAIDGTKEYDGYKLEK